MIRLLFLLCLSSLIATAENGDTTYVQVHDNTDMTWYGHYKDWGEFPSGDESYRKVLMHFTMGCASTGCSGWDYDVHILMRNRTGVLDSNIVLAPSFKLNNENLSYLYLNFFFCPFVVSVDKKRNIKFRERFNSRPMELRFRG